MSITKIVSGGQTGADRGGLAAAIHCRIPHGGWCPLGGRAEDGTIPLRYQLKETASRDYAVRTEANVVDSDATLIFTYGSLEGGSLRTAQAARKHKRPLLHVDLMEKQTRQQTVDRIVQWLQESCPKECVLNVAGQRASEYRPIAGIVKARMVDVISRANKKLAYPIDDNDFFEDEEGGGGDMDGAPLEEQKRIAKAVQDRIDAMTLYHPKTLEEAAGMVIEKLSSHDKEMVRQCASADAFATEQRSNLCLWINNTMIYRNENGMDLMANFQKGCQEGKWSGTTEPDNVSGVIVRLVWERLKTAGT